MGPRVAAVALVGCLGLLGAACGRRGATVSTAPDAGAPTQAPTCPAGTTAAGAAPPRGLSAWCVDANGRQHGPAVEWFDDGTHRSHGAYEHGRRHGPWRSYYVGGQVRAQREYREGQAFGTWTTYFADGSVATSLVHRGADEVHVTEYAPGGHKVAEGKLVAGVRDGAWTDWDPSGQAQRSLWVRGVVQAGASAAYAKIGVAECDDYLERFGRCVDQHMPADQRPAMRDALTQTHKAWLEAAAGPAREGLATACKAALDAGRSAAAGLGCTW